MDREHARLKEEKKQDANTKPWADCVVVVDYEEWSRSPSSVFFILMVMLPLAKHLSHCSNEK